MKVFISHAKQDNPVVYRILKIIDDHGIPKWVDLEQLEGIGSSINESINDGISTSNYFLLVWSKDASESEFVKKEYNAATSQDYDARLEKIIIKLDDTPLPPLLADKKYHSVNEENLEAVLNGIFEKIGHDKEYQENTKRFDEHLDESFGDVVIGNHDYSTSYALKQVDPTVYEDDMTDWLYSEENLGDVDET